MTNPANAPQTEHFDSLADRWWDENGAFGALHAMNPTRVKFIKRVLFERYGLACLDGLKALDVGCGGGILCESLSRLKAEVKGIDASREAIASAIEHAKAGGLVINYSSASLNDLTGEKHDLVTCLEVLEHVDDVNLICGQLAAVLKPAGTLVVSTLNRTIAAYAVGILGAEYLTGMVPVGTHDHKKFLKPHEVAEAFAARGLTPLKISGISYSPFSGNWELSDNVNINYIMAFGLLT